MGFDDSGNNDTSKTSETSKEIRDEQLMEVQVAAAQQVSITETDWETEWEKSLHLLRDLKQKGQSQSYLTLTERELIDLRSIVIMNRALVSTFITGLENKESKWHSGDGTDRQKLIATMMDMAQRLYHHNSIMKGMLEKIQTRLNTPEAVHPATPVANCIHLRK